MVRVRNDELYSSRKQEILSEAARVFRQRGYKQTTMEDLAEQLGRTKAGIYHYFDSKDELLIQICENAVDTALAQCSALEEQDLSPAKKFEVILREHILTVASNLDTFTVFLREQWKADHPRARAIRMKQRKFQEMIERILRDGQRQGTIRGLDPRIVTYAILGMSHGAHEWMGKTNSTTADIADTVVAMVCDGVLIPDGDRDGVGSTDAADS